MFGFIINQKNAWKYTGRKVLLLFFPPCFLNTKSEGRLCYPLDKFISVGTNTYVFTDNVSTM
jgi:hypothetical protein